MLVTCVRIFCTILFTNNNIKIVIKVIPFCSIHLVAHLFSTTSYIILICKIKYKPKNTNKYGVRRFTVNILVSTQVNVDGFLEKNLQCKIQNCQLLHFVKGVKGEYFINKKDFEYRPWNFIKSGFL